MQVKVCLTTDHPNGGPFTRYPRIIAWLMSNEYRTKYIEEKVHNWAQRRGNIATIDREYTFFEVAQVTRATAAKVLGLRKIRTSRCWCRC